MGDEQGTVRDACVTACVNQGRTKLVQHSSSGLQRTDCSGSA